MKNIVEEVMWDQACSDGFEETSQCCTLKYLISSQVQVDYLSLSLPFLRTQEKEQMPFPLDLVSRDGAAQKRYKHVSEKRCPPSLG